MDEIIKENTEKASSNYELGFHMMPDLDEAELKSGSEQIESILKNFGGNILSIKEARRTRLSYPIDHKTAAYFGTIDFESEPELIEKLKQELRLQEKILRFIILKHEKDEQVLGAVTRVRRKPKAIVAPAVEKTMPKEEEVKQKEIEKQIEEVIEKI